MAAGAAAPVDWPLDEGAAALDAELPAGAEEEPGGIELDPGGIELAPEAIELEPAGIEVSPDGIGVVAADEGAPGDDAALSVGAGAAA